MLGYLFVSWNTPDNVYGEIFENLFAPNGGYCVYYPSNLFETLAVSKIREYSWKFLPVLAGEHLAYSNQSRASENI